MASGFTNVLAGIGATTVIDATAAGIIYAPSLFRSAAYALTAPPQTSAAGNNCRPLSNNGSPLKFVIAKP